MKEKNSPDDFAMVDDFFRRLRHFQHLTMVDVRDLYSM